MRREVGGALCGLGAAALFGVSAPLAKLLLSSVSTLVLAGLLYLGGGLALLATGLWRRRHEAPLRRSDLPALLGVVALGGVVGPVLMLTGLARVSAVAGSLLLNLEAPFTILLAVALFREHLGRRGAAATALILAGAAVLGYAPGALRADPLGVAAIAGACLSWAIDNNLTQRLSLRDPVAVVRIKALGAGACSLALAAATGDPWPRPGIAAAALVVGMGSYGASILLDMYALRLLGAAREAAFFATAPFVGALASIPILGERPGAVDGAAMLLLAAGAWLLLRERHSHLHAHEPVEHEHLHVHDEHHRHAHDGPAGEPHSHLHRHAPIVHDHPHAPDLHHRHPH